MNHLQDSHSPYLQQHADNPVEWYAWGEEALRVARRTHRPILVSIGYSTCHWCHVMERESFTDTGIAAYMNQYFVNIKIDREERPDLDQIYMASLQILTGQTGWPLHMFLTPDLRPFYGGTYFPPEPDGRQRSWLQALQFAAYNFHENRPAVEREANRVERRLRGDPTTERRSSDPDAGVLAYHNRLLAQIDHRYGGFGKGRKFPNISALDFLLRWYYHHGDAEALAAVQFSLRQMLWSGTYDLVGGGLMRYSTLPDWSVPHFEKMLYDNAQLIRLLADLYRIDGDPEWAWFLHLTVAFLQRELALPNGGFAAALDADSGGQEGGYYTWTLEQWKAALPNDWSEVGLWFGISVAGNWQSTNILHPGKKLSIAAWAPIRKQLYADRQNREAPGRDDKAVNSWNSLLLTALVHAWEALGDEKLYELARQQSQFLQQTYYAADGHLVRISSEHKTYQAGFLDDYTFFAEAMLAAYRLDYDTAYLAVAKKYAGRAEALFAVPEEPGWFSTSHEHDNLFLRKQADLDEELPAASAWYWYIRHILGLSFDSRDWRWPDELEPILKGQVQRTETTGVASWAALLLAYQQGIRELAIIGAGAQAAAREWMRQYHPDVLLMAADQPQTTPYPLLQHRHHKDGELHFYLCRNYTCRQPVKNPDALLDIWTD